MKRILIFTFMLLTCAAVSAGNRVKDSKTHYACDVLEPYVSSGQLPGAISIFYNNGVQETCCIGYANVEKKVRMNMNRAFMQCSQTKGFCGVTIAKLVEEGRISLDDPVSKYLPEFKELWVLDSKENGVMTCHKAKNVLTIRMVMNHTGGFPFEISAKQGNLPGGGWSGGAPLRQTAAIAAASPLMFEPGTNAQYSNTGIDIGAAVVEAVTGMKWEDYLKKEVLDPLGMKSSWFWPSDRQLKKHIGLYLLHDNAPAEWRGDDPMQQAPFNDSHVFASAGAGLWTTAADQLKFYKMLMNLGVGDNGVRILKEETVLNILATDSRPEGVPQGYSLGLYAPDKETDEPWIGHGGAFGTNCNLNYRTKQLTLWVVQYVGGPQPWMSEMAEASERFFNATVDRSGAEAYTGRTE